MTDRIAQLLFDCLLNCAVVVGLPLPASEVSPVVRNSYKVVDDSPKSLCRMF